MNTVPVTRLERLLVLAILTPLLVAGYVYLNNHPPVTPRSLPLTFVDLGTPFWVWTIWPYTLLTCSTLILPFFICGRDNFRKMATTVVVANLILFAFWAAYPTSYPRPAPPLGGDLSVQLYLSLIQADTPLNCFPSAHVTTPSVQLFFVCSERPKWARRIWATFGVLTLSILTTKQHYVWDLFGAVVTVAVALRLVSWGGLFSNDTSEVHFNG